MPTKQEYYDALSGLAVTAEAGGLAKERAVLLLWFFRNVVGVDDLDAYEYVCDGDDDGGVDALFLEPSSGDDNFETLVIYQSKYTEGPTQVGETAIDRLVSIASKFKTEAGLREFLNGRVEDRLRSLVTEFRLVSKLAEGRYSDGRLRIRLVLVTSGVLNANAKRLVEATNAANASGYLTVNDLNRLGPLAVATTTPQKRHGRIEVPCPSRERFVVGAAPNRVAVAAVRATDIVQWPGIDDRTLFDLNVRREIRMNRVRRQLDAAIARQSDHRDFLAYHNGLTVTCKSFDDSDGTKLGVTDPSVVNGGQSVVALFAAAALGNLTDDLRLTVKFVEVEGRPQLAKEVSRRSNTQNPVNLRNLVALGGPQQRLVTEFAEKYPSIYYETRPDASAPVTGRMIRNDDAAQLLCAVCNAMPWLAVKRTLLFDSDNHSLIFAENITADHVVLVDEIRQAVDLEKERFPAEYRRSWQLTRLVAVYLVGQLIRASSDPAIAGILADPGAAVRRPGLSDDLRGLARFAAAGMKLRRERFRREPTAVDAFNVDFKNQTRLHELRDATCDHYVVQSTLEE